MKIAIAIAAILAAVTSIAEAQTIAIKSASESASNVDVVITTDIATPFEVMVSVNLAGQKDDDVWIGRSTRANIRSLEQTISIPKLDQSKSLPSGNYIVEVNFYPRWGAEKSPASTKAIKKNVSATLPIKISGSGKSSSAVAKQNENQRWVMENTAIGDSFVLASFQRKLGRSESTVVSNRNGIIVAHYFPESDITLFENTLKHTLVTWRLGKQNTL